MSNILEKILLTLFLLLGLNVFSITHAQTSALIVDQYSISKR
jgi:hypothetical protein